MESTLDYTLLENMPETKGSLVYQLNTSDSLNLIETSIDMLKYRTATEERKLAEQAIRRFKKEINDHNSQLNLNIQHAWQLAGNELTDMGSGAYASAFCMTDLAMETEIRHNFEGDIPAPEGPPTDNELLTSSLKDLEQQLDDSDPTGISNIINWPENMKQRVANDHEKNRKTGCMLIKST